MLAPGEVKIKARRLAELEAKERGHDVYLRATRRMRGERVGITDPDNGKSHQFVAGWLSSVNRFAELIAEEDRNG